MPPPPPRLEDLAPSVDYHECLPPEGRFRHIRIIRGERGWQLCIHTELVEVLYCPFCGELLE